MKIAFSPPDIGEQEISEVVDTLRSGWITTGPKVKIFEQKISDYCGTNKSVCFNSQTASAELTLRLLGIGPGDEVITSAYTYTASCSIICHVGATPVLIDTAPGSYEMDYNLLENAITPKTKVIIPVDIGGVICDYERIYKIINAKKHMFSPNNKLQEAFGRIIISADTAHSFGATQNGKVSGSIADFSSFSFHAVKNLTTAEGGAATWKNVPGISDDEIYKQLKLLSLHGQNKDALQKSQLGGWEYDIIDTYYKCNMTDIAAALGLAQLARYPDLLKRRRCLVEMYHENLKNKELDTLQHYGENFSGSGHLYMLRLLGKDEIFRNKLIAMMAESGISCNVHFKPLPLLSAYKRLGFDISDFPNAFNQYENEITLPLHTRLTNEQLNYITDALISFL